MGIRLFPMTTDQSVLERLAGVPKGTSLQYRNLQSTRIERRKDVVYYLEPGRAALTPVLTYKDFFDMIERDQTRVAHASNDISWFHRFLNSGWGCATGLAKLKLRDLGFEVPDEMEVPSLPITDPKTVFEILFYQGVNVCEHEGRYYVSPEPIVGWNGAPLSWQVRRLIPIELLKGVYWC